MKSTGAVLVHVGYVNETDAASATQLITGQGWLVRGGKSYVTKSLQTEPMRLQRSGSPYHFAALIAPRLAVGIDVAHRIVVVAVDGLESAYRGVTLFEFADILIRLGLQQAINLDGGGSVSMFVNESLVSIPSDVCNGSHPFAIRCPRKVSTALCLGALPFRSSSPSETVSHSLTLTSTHTGHFETNHARSLKSRWTFYMLLLVLLLSVCTAVQALCKAG